MSGHKPHFTSDRRLPSDCTWVGSGDWKEGIHSGSAVVDNALTPEQSGSAFTGFPNVVDHFLDGGLGEYSYSGSRGNYSVVSDSPSAVYDHGLRASISAGPGGNLQIQSEEGDGLQYYPQEGDTVRVGSYIADLRDCTHRIAIGTQYGYKTGIFAGIDTTGNNTGWHLVLGDRAGGNFEMVPIDDPRGRTQHIELQKSGSTGNRGECLGA